MCDRDHTKAYHALLQLLSALLRVLPLPPILCDNRSCGRASLLCAQATGSKQEVAALSV